MSTLPDGATVLPMPALSPTMTSGNIANWNIKELETFETGQSLCEIETDKATVDYEAVDDGILAKILAPENSKDLEVGTPIAVVTDDNKVAEQIKAMDLSFLLNSDNSTNPTVSSANETAPSQAIEKPIQMSQQQGQIRVAPSAGMLLRSYGVDPSSVTPTHRLASGGMVISKSDAMKAVTGKSLVKLSPVEAKPVFTSTEQKASDRSPINLSTEIIGGDYEDIPVTTMRKVISTNLTQAKQSRPHFYATVECEIDNVLAWRKDMKQKLGVAPSINDIIVKAASLALRDVPRVNCQLGSDGSVIQNKSVDVAVAVATPSGLITPIVTNSDQKGVMQISTDMKDLAARAKNNKLKLNEFQGGSFTVSNLGMFGITDFTAVINPPQSAILAVGGGQPSFNCDDPMNPRAVTNITVQLSSDRRVIDDMSCGQFLQCFRSYLAEPMLMTL